MNQERIGKFIAKCRKEQKLTQEELAEKLNITYKAVSKWECGKSLPDASIMMDLCTILEINVNDLLSGKKVDKDKYADSAEENLLILTKQIEKRKSILKKIQKLLLFFAVCLFISNMVFNSMYGDNWDRKSILYITYILMSVNFGIAVIISFLSFDKKESLK